MTLLIYILCILPPSRSRIRSLFDANGMVHTTILNLAHSAVIQLPHHILWIPARGN